MSKGSKNQANLAKLFTAWTGWEFHSVPRSGGLRWGRDMRVIGDLICDIDHAEEFPFSIETKVRKPKMGRKSKIIRNKVEIGDLLIKKKDGFIWESWMQCTEDATRGGKSPLMCLRNDRMASTTYFTFLEKQTGMAICNELSNSKNYLLTNNKLNLFITTTDWLFKLPSEKVFDIVRKML